jgi:hypothetical protein
MDRVARTALSSFQRVQQFITQLPQAESSPTLGAQAAELDDVIARLSSSSIDQEAGRRFVRVHSESQRNLRRSLYADHMQPISRVAREVFGVSGMDRAFRMPPKSVADRTLLAAAGAMAEAAQKEQEMFVKHGLAPDFIDTLKGSAAALDVARSAKVESGRRRVTATAAVTELVKRGKKAVRLLNAILQPRLAKDPELLAAWRSAKRVPPVTTAATDAASAPSSIKVA